MPFFKTDDLQAWTGGSWFNLNSKKTDIRGFGIDSRNIQPDFAFVALKGERDGCDFAADAVKNGATAVIADRELDVGAPVLVVKNPLKALQTVAKLHRLRFENPVVAITGSCGKTSTKETLAKLLSWKNPVYTEKNYNNEIGVPLTLTKIDIRQNQLAIVEAGVGAPDQMRELAEMIEPDIAIVTNVGLAHLERFKDVASVAREKAVLPAHVAENGWCVMHQNLLSWKAFDELTCKKAVLASADAPDVKADLVFRYAVSKIDGGMSAIDMCVEGGEEYYFEVPQMSAGMLDNTLLAIAASLMLGAKEEQLAAKIETLKPLPMRGGIVESGGVKYYIDCYNASPTSMRDALQNFAEIAKDAPKLYVLGSMAELGIATHRHHKEVGANIPFAEGCKAVLVGVSADIYKAGLLENGWNEADISVFDTSQAAAEKILEFTAGFVFVKGSRVCELEKALPPAVLKAAGEAEVKAEEEISAPAEEPEPQDDEPPADAPERQNENGEDDEDDESFDEDGAEDFDDSDGGIDFEDEREF